MPQKVNRAFNGGEKCMDDRYAQRPIGYPLIMQEILRRVSRLLGSQRVSLTDRKAAI